MPTEFGKQYNKVNKKKQLYSSTYTVKINNEKSKFLGGGV